jgi:EmrB/QacA subfamily drug resistance transporter
MHAAAPEPDAPIGDALDERVHARRWFTLATMCLSLSIITMDNTILNIAIPNLVDDLGVSNSQLQWIVDGYTLVFASALLTMGSLGDRFGRKLALRIGLIVFALGSIGSALSGSAAALIAMRSTMGIGAALMMPSTLSIITNVFRDPRERARAIAIWAAVSALGLAAGPLLGGALIKHFSWSSVFWINVPVAGIAVAAGYFFVPESKDSSAPRLDPFGTLLSFTGLASLLFAIIEGPTKGWTSPGVIGAFALGFTILLAFVLWERHTDHPMLDMSFFTHARFTAASFSITLVFFTMFGILFLMTQYWQFVHGYSPLQAAVRLVPYALVMMVATVLSARIVERVGTKLVVATGLFVVSAGLVLLSFVGAHSSYPRVIGILTIIGVGVSLVMPACTESVMGSLPRDKAGVGSAVNDTTRQMGGALGIAVMGSVVASMFASRIDAAAGEVGLSPDQLSTSRESLGASLEIADTLGAKGARFAELAREAFVSGLDRGALIGAIVMVIGGLLALRFLPARARDPLALDVPGHPIDVIDEEVMT